MHNSRISITSSNLSTRLSLLPLAELLYQFGQRREFPFPDELELVDKEDKVLEAGVKVVLHPERHDVGEVGVVDVRVDSEQTFEYYLYNGLELSWEWYS